MNSTGIIILAAGSSTRLGRAKQLLAWRGKSLLKHVTDEALQAGLSPVVVILGADAEQVGAMFEPGEIGESPVSVIRNEDWEKGMSGGIRKGLQHLEAAGSPGSVIISVCDQPYLSAAFFKELIRRKEETGKGIVASAYAGTVGVPVLFDAAYFAELRSLKDGDGAKRLLSTFKEDVATIDFPQGAIDIDTPADYLALIDNQHTI